MTNSKEFQEGFDAFDAHPNDVPEPPYAEGSDEAREWIKGYRAAHDEG